MRLSLGYPSRSAEKLLLQQSSRQQLIATLDHVFSQQEILELQQLVEQMHVGEKVLDYILDLAEESRKGRHGLSTRGVLALKKATQAHALVEQRNFVTPDDVQAVFVAVASHRIGMHEAETLALMQRVTVC